MVERRVREKKEVGSGGRRRRGGGGETGFYNGAAVIPVSE